jgi:hypothetical protein
LASVRAIGHFRGQALVSKQDCTENETIPPSTRHAADTIDDHKARRNNGFGAMTMAKDITGSGKPARLRPAGGAVCEAAQQPAGPFEVTAEARRPTARDALATGLLVIYPAFAVVAAIIAGLFLTSAGSI